MRKKIKNALKEMVANVDWANAAPDNDNNCTMAYPLPIESEPTSCNTNVAKAVLTRRPNSHPFFERTLLLHEAVKVLVGRSVAKTRPTTDNAIFDCKVLSRLHASLWYENGHFYLMDTKSSNGTFVNNHRLSEGSQASVPHEVCSGDIVQFGVDVMENACSVTHGCIVATLRLYLPDGKEAKASQSTTVKSPTHLDDLYQLHQFIQEAMQRENFLESKLLSLRQVVEGCRSAVASSWQALVCEERLLGRVQFLERRLAASSSTNQPTELQQLLDDKHQYEVSVKEALRVAHEERLKLMNKLGALQWSICSSEEECAALRDNAEWAHHHLRELGGEHSALQRQMQEAREALKTAERQVTEERQRVAELSLQQDNRLNHAENSENGLTEEALDNDRDTWIIDNNSWTKSDQKESSLTEDLTRFPKYINGILPNNVPDTMTRRSLDPQRRLLQTKLSALKDELFKLEENISEDEANDNSAHGEPHIPSEKESLQNSTNDNHLVDDCSETTDISTIVDGECNLQDSLYSECQQISNINDSNLENNSFLEKFNNDISKESKMKLLRDEINILSEELNQLDDEIQKNPPLQEELTPAQSEVINLQIETQSANPAVMQPSYELSVLKVSKDILTSQNEELQSSLEEKVEECRKLALELSQKEKEKTDEVVSSKYKQEAEELQNQLSQALESETKSAREIQRLILIISDTQKQLDERPLSSEMETITGNLEKLQVELTNKEQQIQLLNIQICDLTNVQHGLEEQLKNPPLDQNCSHNSKTVCDKVSMTDLETAPLPPIQTSEDQCNHVVISSSLAAADLGWGNDSKPLSTEDGSFSSVSVDLKRLTELEEELVVTKEKWAHINEDRSQLTSELQNLTEKYNRLASRSLMDSIMYVVPVAAVLIYMLMYQYIS